MHDALTSVFAFGRVVEVEGFSGLFRGLINLRAHALCRVAPRTLPVSCDFAIEASCGAPLHRACPVLLCAVAYSTTQRRWSMFLHEMPRLPARYEAWEANDAKAFVAD